MRTLARSFAHRLARLALVCASFLLLVPAAVRAETLAIDPVHSHVGFSIRHFFTPVKGEFKTVSGTIELDPKDLNATRVNVAIDPASISTDNERRDNHLKSADFFDVAKFPTLTFVATAVHVDDPKAFTGTLTGDLTMHGVTRPVTLKLEGGGMQSGDKGTLAGFSASGKLDRKDFGILWNKVVDQGALMLGDDVTLDIAVEARTAPPASSTAPAAPAGQAAQTSAASK